MVITIQDNGGSGLVQLFPLAITRVLKKIETKKIASDFFLENDWCLCYQEFTTSPFQQTFFSLGTRKSKTC